MAIDSQHTSTTDRDAAIESHKDARARAFLIISAAGLAVILIIAAVVHFAGTDKPTTPVATRPSEATVEAQDKAGAVETIQQYNAASDLAHRNGTIAGAGLERVADYNIIQAVTKIIQIDKSAGTTFRGNTVLSLTPTQWERTSTFDRLVTVKVCADLSKAIYLDAQGKPIQNVNPDGTPNNRKRIPSTFYVEAMATSSSKSTYKVRNSVPDPDKNATC